MAYVDPNTVHNPASGSIAPAAWGDQVRDDIIDLDARANATSGVVTTSQTTTSTSYADLTTTGPAVTVTTGTQATIDFSAAMNTTSVNGQCFVAVAVSGATTRAAGDSEALYLVSFSASVFQRGGCSITITGLTAGSNTFTLRYRVSAGTGTFADRRISVRPSNKLA